MHRTQIFALVLAGAMGCSGPTSSPTSAPTSTPALSDTPKWFAVLAKGEIQWHDARTGEALGARGGPSRTRLTTLAPWHDDRSIVLGGTKLDSPTCRSLVQRQVRQSDNTLVMEGLADLDAIPGTVEGLAVTNDHTKLALAIRVPLSPGKPCGSGDQQVQLWVVDLATQARRVWALPVDHPSRPDEPSTDHFLDHLAWAPDGRHLALEIGVCCDRGGPASVLDTRTRPGSLEPLAHEVPAPTEGCVSMHLLWTSRGLLHNDCRTEELQFVDPATGEVTGTLASLEEDAEIVSLDTSGKHYLVYTGQAVFRIDEGRTHRLLSLPWDPEQPPSAVW